MDWKKLLQKPWTAIAGLSAFTGLLVDCQGAASKMVDVIPILSAFLPTFAIAGTAGFSSWIVYSGFRWIWNILPAQRFYSHYESNSAQIHHCLDLLTEAVESCDAQPSPYIYSQIQQLIPILRKFDIKFPEKVGDQNHHIVWFNFLVQLTACAKQHDLNEARSITKRLESRK